MISSVVRRNPRDVNHLEPQPSHRLPGGRRNDSFSIPHQPGLAEASGRLPMPDGTAVRRDDADPKRPAVGAADAWAALATPTIVPALMER